MSRDTEVRNKVLILMAISCVLLAVFTYFVLAPYEEKKSAECDKFAASVDMSLPANQMIYKLCMGSK